VELLDLGERRSGIVSFRVTGEAPHSTQARLSEGGINVSISDRQSAQIDFSARGIDASVRASVHYFNTEGEIQRFVDAVRH
jgi:selenocysteine lyase/cysteine desulfurase